MSNLKKMIFSSLLERIKQPYVPKDVVETNIKLGKARGKLGIGKRVGMQVRSKLDRLLSSRQVE